MKLDALLNPGLRALRLATPVVFALGLAACAVSAPPGSVKAAAPDQWYAPLPGLPHQGQLGELRRWWRQFDDPVLVELIDAAERASSSIAAAATRIEQARATQVGAQAALGPTLDASASASRGNATVGIPLNTTLRGGLQASWELDLFGRNRAARDAARARLEGAQALWHEARVSVAAEVANQYIGARYCEQQLAIAAKDSQSRSESARLADINVKAGFSAPASGALAHASAAQGRSALAQQQAQCELGIKALVALTALPEPLLRARLAAAPAAPPQAPGFSVASIPAQLLLQRPDVFNAEREVAAASADVGSTEGLAYPRLSLTGSVGRARYVADGQALSLNTWSIGPFTLSAPLFDGGRLAANVESAKASYKEAVQTYQSRVRTAVREVEEALVHLQSSAARGDDARVVVAGYQSALAASETRYRSGLGSLPELEESRRSALQAELSLLALQQERASDWIALYRAVGGGWEAPNNKNPGP